MIPFWAKTFLEKKIKVIIDLDHFTVEYIHCPHHSLHLLFLHLLVLGAFFDCKTFPGDKQRKCWREAKAVDGVGPPLQLRKIKALFERDRTLKISAVAEDKGSS